jgi:hypothetical protein
LQQNGIQITSENKELYKNITTVSFMIFRTGSVLIVGMCEENVLNVIYDFLTKLLKAEFKYISQSVIGVGGQVTNNQFNVTLNDVESYFINDIPKIEGKTQIDIVFILKAYKGQEQPVVQQFPFKVWYTLPNQSQVPVVNVPSSQTLPTFPPQKIAFIKIGESTELQGRGWDYYNIKKPDGGYITYQLTTEEPFDEPKAINNRVLYAETYEIASYGGSGGAATQYTNLININKLGNFRLQVQYKPYGNTSPIGGEVLVQTIVSDVFTL